MGEVRLSRVEREVTATFFVAVTALAGMCAGMPERAEALRLAAVGKLDERGRQLVVALAAQIEEGHDRG